MPRLRLFPLFSPQQQTHYGPPRLNLRKGPALDLDTESTAQGGGLLADSQSLVWHGEWLLHLPLGSPEVFLLKSKTAPADEFQSPRGVDVALQEFQSQVPPALRGKRLTFSTFLPPACLAAASLVTSSSISGPSEPPAPPPTQVSSMTHTLMLDYTKCVLFFTNW